MTNNSYTQTTAQTNPQYITTSVGDIAVYVHEVPHTTPVIFLHGVYYDHHL